MVQRRKNQLKALFGAIEPAANPLSQPSEAPVQNLDPVPAKPEIPIIAKLDIDPPAPQVLKANPPQRASSGAVKAMALSLGGLTREVEEARRLRESLESGDHVSEIAADLIDASFVSDRLEQDQAQFQELVESIRNSGQLVPVLLRPHPEQPGRFQTAYGHRRVRAAGALGLKVKALVRTLSDVELVVAQGKENSDRRDLTFIERALFAHELIARGFERGLVQDALSLHKAEMTRFLQIAEIVPRKIAEIIGAAPKIGRPRWMLLAELLRDKANLKRAEQIVAKDGFRELPSDQRFNSLLSELQQKPVAEGSDEKAVSREIQDGAGRVIAKLSANRGKARLDMVEGLTPQLADFLSAELPKLLQRFEESAASMSGAK